MCSCTANTCGGIHPTALVNGRNALEHLVCAPTHADLAIAPLRQIKLAPIGMPIHSDHTSLKSMQGTQGVLQLHTVDNRHWYIPTFLCFDQTALISFTAMCNTITAVHGSGRGGVAATHTGQNDRVCVPMYMLTTSPQIWQELKVKHMWTKC